MYEKQTWNNGDIITAEKLNHMEEGIASSGAKVVKCIFDMDNEPYTLTNADKLVDLVESDFEDVCNSVVLLELSSYYHLEYRAHWFDDPEEGTLHVRFFYVNLYNDDSLKNSELGYNQHFKNYYVHLYSGATNHYTFTKDDIDENGTATLTH